MISIIIIVKNDKRISKLLKALQTIKKSEKTEVLVIDASNGNLEDVKKTNSFAKWIPYVSNKQSHQTTIPEQRNSGIKHAKGNIIVFIDSDCVPERNWLEKLTVRINKNKEHIIAGKVKHSNANSSHSKETETHKDGEYIGEAPTMNIAISKKVFDDIGYFDEHFQCGEDVDFLWRAIKKGYKIQYAANAIVYHDLGNFSKELRRMYSYGKARTSLYRKHSYKWRIFVGSELFSSLYFLYFLFLPLSLVLPIYPLLIVIPIIKYRSVDPFKMIAYKTSYGTGMLKEIVIPSK